MPPPDRRSADPPLPLPNRLDPARWRRPVSLRARLTLVFGVAMALMLAGLGAFIYLRLATELASGVDRSLGARADALTAELESSSSADPGPPLGGGHRFVDPDEAFAQILDPSGRVLDSTPAVAAAPLLTRAQVTRIARIDRPTFLTRPHRQPDDSDRLLAVPARAADGPVIAVVGETLGDRRDALRHLLTLYAVTGPAGLLLTCVAGWVLAGAALRPVEAIRASATQLSHSNPAGRLPVPGTGDELTRLTITLNDLLARLHAAVGREHRFVNDASHELRTPLAVLKAELDLATSRPRTAIELHATVTTAAIQTDRLITLAEALLVLARARQGGALLRRTPTHLPTLLAEAIAPLQNQAERAGAAIHIDTGANARSGTGATARDDTVEVDPDQIGRAVRNLVENAIRHGGDDLTITTGTDGDILQIDVIDNGPGIPECLLPTVFDPFTRARTVGTQPPATAGPTRVTSLLQHQRGVQPWPGTGLGLAIVKAIAEAHHGTATASNTSGGGAHLQLRLRLPRSPTP